MALSYPLDFTSLPTAQSVVFRAVSATEVNRSNFTFEQTTYVWSGGTWEMDVVLPPMFIDDAEDWIAALVSLNGAQGTFTLSDPSRTAARGGGTGSPVVNGNHSAGDKTLETRSWTGTNPIVKAGDWIQIGSPIYKVMEDADSVGSPVGGVTIEIWPGLRTNVNDGVSVGYGNPSGIWRLAQNFTTWSVDPERYQIAFTAVEAL